MKKNVISQLLFIISYSLIMASDMLSNFNPLKVVLPIMSYLGITLIMITIILQCRKYTFKSMLLIFFSILLIALICFDGLDKHLIYLLLFIISFKNVDFDTFIKRIFFVRLGVMLFILLGHFCGFTSDVIMQRADGTIRNSMGFAHPNRFGACIFELVLEYIYIVRNNIKLREYIILIGMIFLINYVADSRSIFIVLSLLIIMLFVNQKTEFFSNKITKWICICSPFIVLLATSSVIYLFINNNSYIIQFNRLLTGRIKLMVDAYNSAGITLFGSEYIYNVDNAYIQALLKYGSVFLLTFLCAYSSVIKKIYNNKMFVLVIIIVIYIIYGFTEAYLLRVTYNAFLLLLGSLIYKNMEESR